MLKNFHYNIVLIVLFVNHPIHSMNNAGANAPRAGAHPHDIPPAYDIQEFQPNHAYAAAPEVEEALNHNDHEAADNEVLAVYDNAGNYVVPQELQSVRPLIALLHSGDVGFKQGIIAIEQAGQLINNLNIPYGITLWLNNVQVDFDPILFEDLESHYPDKMERIHRLKAAIRRIKMGHGWKQFVDWPLFVFPVIGGLTALIKSVAVHSLFQTSAMVERQNEEAIALYGIINDHVHLLLERAAQNGAIEALVKCKEDLINFLKEKDANLHLLTLPLDKRVLTNPKDIIGPSNPPYIITYYNNKGGFARQIVFDDETASTFFISHSPIFMLEALIKYNISRVKAGNRRYSLEQKELLLTYFEAALAIFADHRWRLQKPSIKQGLKYFGASLVLGVVFGYLARWRSVNQSVR